MCVCLAFFTLFGAQTVCASEEGETAAEDHGTLLSVDPTGEGDGYSSILYDNTNGLPTAEANAIAETSEGFIWIGAYSGLIRYDGNTFERFDSTTGVTSVVSLYVDSRDRLWIGTNDSGAGVLEKNDLRMYNKNDGLSSLSIRGIAEDSAGTIYLATTHGIATVGTDMELAVLDEPQINEQYIRMLYTGSDDVIYGLTNDGAVFTIKDRKLTGFYDSSKLGIEDIRTIHPDPNAPGHLYIGTEQSSLIYGELQNGLRDAIVTDTAPLEYLNMISVIDDRPWVCADNGIGIMKDGKFKAIKNIPLYSSVEQVMTDYQGNLWFVSSKQGVMKIVPNQFTDISERYGLDDTVINTTCMFKGELYIGEKMGGLTVIGSSGVRNTLPVSEAVTASGENIPINELKSLLSGCKIRSIIRGSDNDIWFSGFGDRPLVRYDGSKAVVFTIADGIPSDRVRAVCRRRDGSYMAACTGGLAIIKDDRVTEVYSEDSGISNMELLTAVEAENGDMIIGTDGGGLFIINDTKTVHLGTESGLNSDVVMRIKHDEKRNLFWIVTSNSLAYMTADYKITTIQKFPYSNNFDMFENKDGDMWILSSNGIYVTPVDELLANGEISPVFYGRDNGLPCITNANSYSELTDNGDLYISGTTGVAKVNIDTPFENISTVNIAVPFAEADGEMIYADDSGRITVPSKIKKLTIYCYVFNYSLMNPEVTYNLTGFDDKETTVRRSDLVPIDYTNLRGGSYTFNVRLSDIRGEGNNELSVRIIKEKAFYEMIWFRAALIILILGIIIGVTMFIIHRRTERFLKKEREQRTLIREIVEAFAKVIDMKDKYTNGHSTRVAEYTEMLTRELGYDEETVEKYRNIALLHDIGKVGISSDVLNKPGKLTDLEFAKIKSHSKLGYNTLKDISIMPELAEGAKSHHERPDGKGYPEGLPLEKIPRFAQIIAVADTFDAMYSDRPYRKRMNFEKAVSIIKEVSGTQLTADVVDAFLRLVDKGKFRAEDDKGGGTTEDIDNIHRKFEKDNAVKEAEKKAAEILKAREEAAKAAAGESSGKDKHDEKPAETKADAETDNKTVSTKETKEL